MLRARLRDASPLHQRAIVVVEDIALRPVGALLELPIPELGSRLDERAALAAGAMYCCHGQHLLGVLVLGPGVASTAGPLLTSHQDQTTFAPQGQG